MIKITGRVRRRDINSGKDSRQSMIDRYYLNLYNKDSRNRRKEYYSIFAPSTSKRRQWAQTASRNCKRKVST
jgi:hypothetical protein